MTAIFLLAFLLVALMATAVVAAPLRRASPRSWLAVLAAVPLLAIACYQILGTPAALDPARRALPARRRSGCSLAKASSRRSTSAVCG